MLNITVKNISKRLPDARHHQVKYALYFKKLPHLSKPTGFSEKIMRRKIYPRSIYTTLSDKFKVREFIAGLWGEEYRWSCMRMALNSATTCSGNCPTPLC